MTASKERERVDKWTVKNKQKAFSIPAASTFRSGILYTALVTGVTKNTQRWSRMKNAMRLQLGRLWRAWICFQLCVWFPDEGALVRAAQNLGFVFSGRTPDSVIVEMVRGTGQTGPGTLSVQVYYWSKLLLLWIPFHSGRFLPWRHKTSFSLRPFYQL